MAKGSTAPASIQNLVERFETHRESYAGGAYNETQLRREFVDPMWKALGWDIDNEQGYAQAYKDVIHEDAIKVSADSYTKAPDYCFRIGGVRKFFVEAKRPSVDIKGDPAPAFQLRRYAWSAKLSLSVLTDFEEFAVYDTRIRPASSDRSSTGRVLFFRYEEYLERWKELEAIFSRESVLKGSFDRFADSSRAKRGTAAVDEAFLSEIEAWRDELARNIALRNSSLTQRELNYAVQATIDRLVFLRICEDRGIEPYGELRSVTNGANIYARVFELFQRADARYNSGLFHFKRERGRESEPDELSSRVEIDDGVLKEIIRGLYYPESPYEFSVLGGDILGQVYEQFLGKVIRLTDGHRAIVEEKPEVKKAGGVYYTPTFVVDYIVRQTLGDKLVARNLKKVLAEARAGNPLRVLDPACGSGSFLIGAYQFLLDWYRDQYLAEGIEKHGKGRNPTLYQGSGGEWRLTTSERKRILLTHVFGVDIDEQAVEVTKLSLLLKMLEGESDQSIQAQLRLFHERVLPDLEGNIKCGNSLIGPEFFAQEELIEQDEDVRRRVNAFDWRSEFPAVFSSKTSGFDTILGNPPYVRIQTLTEWHPEAAAFYRNHYATGRKGNFDLYVVFVERCVSLLGKAGALGMILPGKFLATDYGSAMRDLIASEGLFRSLIDFGHEQVFAGATTYTCLLFLERGEQSLGRYARATPDSVSSGKLEFSQVPLSRLGAEPWVFESDLGAGLRAKIATGSSSLLELAPNISRGSSTGADDIFCLTLEGKALRTRSGDAIEIEPEMLRRPIYASDFRRFRAAVVNQERVIFPYEVFEDGYSIIPEADLRRRYPAAYSYLRSQRSLLDRRKQNGPWYGFSAPRSLAAHDSAQFLVPLLAQKPPFSPYPQSASQFCLMASGGFSISLAEKRSEIDPLYVLGLLNSRLLFWNLGVISNKFRGGWIACTKQYVGTLPIRFGGKRGAAQGVLRAKVVETVRELLQLEEQADRVKIEHDRRQVDRQIEAANQRLNECAYRIYELTDAEISMVEQSAP